MNNWNIPVYNAIKKYSLSNPTPFHMPGHKLGKGIPAEFLGNPSLIDLTEIPGTDNLHYPSGAIKEAQELAAAAFGADRTFFLVNGSTCGIHAMIMTICNPGDKIIVGRDCHRSVIGGMILAGASPVYIKPDYDTRFGISTVITPQKIEKALSENPDAAGVLITRPNYYGICSDIEAIAGIVHSYGKILAVDEAHGAHLKFSPLLPPSAMEAGADMCVQSAHKTLPAFTQGAYLHVKTGRVNVERLKFNLSLIQTSSPSYVIMAFLDIARAIMENQGQELLERLLENVRRFDEQLKASDGLITLSTAGENDFRQDSSRLVINVRKTGKTGYGVEKVLREKYNIQVEMSDLHNIVCITTAADRAQDFEYLSRALLETVRGNSDIPGSYDSYVCDLPIPHQKIELAGIMRHEGEKVRISNAAGRTSLAMVTPYPPGIPVICPGEVVMAETIEYLARVMVSGGIVNGIEANGEITVAK